VPFQAADPGRPAWWLKPATRKDKRLTRSRASADYLGVHRKGRKTRHLYDAFACLDGTHPWFDAVPDACMLYPVRELNRGRVTYFNFDLAREMGLIPGQHPDELTPELEAALLKTFAIRIVNEYDQARGRRLPHLKPRRYMATRYLQLQHPGRRGETSGDGRGIWNGTITHNGVTWDVSSRGTGVTRLAPGSVEAGRPLRTGEASHGYGSGLAEMDELYAGAIMSAIFHRQGIPTERVLAIIDIGRNRGIGVRAHPNLIRPAHLLRLLKLNDYENLRRATDYFLDRQRMNHAWDLPATGQQRYSALCAHVARCFAELAARLDVDYIFVWMSWDGDNVLADGSIIDYGSVRQFGLRHDQYRYDDVERFSTNLNEQRLRARQIVQAFLQLADYLRTGRKRSLDSFAEHPEMARFDSLFEQARRERLLQMTGLPLVSCRRILKSRPDLYSAFERHFKYFETRKTSRPVGKVSDGVNRPAIFNLRDLMRELPRVLAEDDPVPVAPSVLFGLMLSRSAAPEDRTMSQVQGERLQGLQAAYLAIVDATRGRRSRKRFLGDMGARSAIVNRSDRITGNAVIAVVDRLMARIAYGLSARAIQRAIDHFVHLQATPPGGNGTPLDFRAPTRSRRLIRSFVRVVEDFREDI
jgi:hypothetical protein